MTPAQAEHHAPTRLVVRRCAAGVKLAFFASETSV